MVHASSADYMRVAELKSLELPSLQVQRGGRGVPYRRDSHLKNRSATTNPPASQAAMTSR